MCGQAYDQPPYTDERAPWTRQDAHEGNVPAGALRIEVPCLECKRRVRMTVQPSTRTAFTCPACGHKQGAFAAETRLAGQSLGVIVGQGWAKGARATAADVELAP